MPLSLEQFVQQLSDSGLVAVDDLSTLQREAPSAEVEQFARALVKRKLLTAYQAQQAYAGKAKALVLGNYAILDKLGQGGMGMVLKAEHRRMKRTVALKVLSPNLTKTPEVVARFHREVQAAARLEHSNIVSAYDADEANGTHFFVMQYVDGQDLSSVVKAKGPLPVRQAVGCIVQAAQGLEYAHKHGVIHRDIKPANLLLDKDGTVKILDMGLARIEGDTGSQAELTHTGAVMGTVDYMAPEQAVSTKSADARSDIYSLGITLWYLLVGRPAFGGDSLMARMLAHRESPIPSLSAALAGATSEPSQFLTALDAVFQKMVAKQPDRRYQTMTEVLAALDACLRGTSGETPSLVAVHSEDSKFSEFLAGLQNTDPGSLVAAKKAKSRGGTATKTAQDSEPTLAVSASEVNTDPHSLLSGLPQKSRTSKRVVLKPWWQKREGQLLAGGMGGALLLIAAVVLLFRTPQGTIRVELNDPAISVHVKGSEFTVSGVDPQPIKVRPGEHSFVVTRGDFSFETQSLSIKKGEVVTLSVELAADELQVAANGQSIGMKAFPQQSSTADATASTTTAVNAPATSFSASATDSVSWTTLFDGKDVSQWQTLGPFRVENGLLTSSTTGLAVTKQDFDAFELEFEWKISEAGNSGVYYRNPRAFLVSHVEPGIEYQIVDNQRHPNGRVSKTSAASLFGLMAPSSDQTRPVGEFNSSRIVARGSLAEHWLNGAKVLSYDSGASTFLAEARANKIGERFDTGEPLRGPIALQGNQGSVWFRQIRIRDLSVNKSADSVTSLFNGRDLAGWKGDTSGFSVQQGVLVASGNLADLITERDYADFEFTMQFRMTAEANSGVGLRYSGQGRPRLTGLEVQLVDGPNTAADNPLERCGGLMQLVAPKYQTFRRWPEWNTLVVQCQGPQIRVELNGVTTVAASTTELLAKNPGHIGLKRKSGSLCLITTRGRAEFRDLQIRELTANTSTSVPADAAAFQGHAYKYFPEQLPWREAKARCASLGGHLVTLESAAENSFVAKLIERQGGNDCWIGMTDEIEEGRWRWVNGQPVLVWTNWHSNNPNNKGGVEHYGLISKGIAGIDVNWQWVDQPNVSTQHQPGYVCEWDSQ